MYIIGDYKGMIKKFYNTELNSENPHYFLVGAIMIFIAGIIFGRGCR